MTEKRVILEMGTGNDLYGEDYTKAAAMNSMAAAEL
ncbi:MAG TPA: Lin0512 family protein, partial [Denitromonas sp.]|nr:Lin0512 family protein [Denitromonas sp.]